MSALENLISVPAWYHLLELLPALALLLLFRELPGGRGRGGVWLFFFFLSLAGGRLAPLVALFLPEPSGDNFAFWTSLVLAQAALFTGLQWLFSLFPSGRREVFQASRLGFGIPLVATIVLVVLAALAIPRSPRPDPFTDGWQPRLLWMDQLIIAAPLFLVILQQIPVLAGWRTIEIKKFLTRLAVLFALTVLPVWPPIWLAGGPTGLWPPSLHFYWLLKSLVWLGGLFFLTGLWPRRDRVPGHRVHFSLPPFQQSLLFLGLLAVLFFARTENHLPDFFARIPDKYQLSDPGPTIVSRAKSARVWGATLKLIPGSEPGDRWFLSNGQTFVGLDSFRKLYRFSLWPWFILLPGGFSLLFLTLLGLHHFWNYWPRRERYRLRDRLIRQKILPDEEDSRNFDPLGDSHPATRRAWWKRLLARLERLAPPDLGAAPTVAKSGPLPENDAGKEVSADEINAPLLATCLSNQQELELRDWRLYSIPETAGGRALDHALNRMKIWQTMMAGLTTLPVSTRPGRQDWRPRYLVKFWLRELNRLAARHGWQLDIQSLEIPRHPRGKPAAWHALFCAWHATLELTLPRTPDAGRQRDSNIANTGTTARLLLGCSRQDPNLVSQPDQARRPGYRLLLEARYGQGLVSPFRGRPLLPAEIGPLKLATLVAAHHQTGRLRTSLSGREDSGYILSLELDF